MRLAAAPISWGVCEVPGWGFQIDRDRVLEDAARLGMREIEAGPPGLELDHAHGVVPLAVAAGVALGLV